MAAAMDWGIGFVFHLLRVRTVGRPFGFVFSFIVDSGDYRDYRLPKSVY